MPLTPQFVLEDDLWWTTTAVFPSWTGFRGTRDAHSGKERASPSHGIVRIVFAPEGRGIAPLTPSEVESVVWVIENEALISEALIVSLLQQYPFLQEQYGYSAAVKADLMPDVSSAADLRVLIGLSSVNVHQVQKDGIPYAGFEFSCTWDDEHGLGVLMHGTRTVEIGGAETAVLLWIAKRDAKREE